MDPEIRGRVDRLLETYSVYYDVETCEEGDLVAKACFHSRGEKYLLTRSVNLWSVEDNEYVSSTRGTASIRTASNTPSKRPVKQV